MITYTCDFKGCNSPIRDQRKIYINRLNPQNIYFRFHICDNHQFQLENYVTDNLKDNANTAEKIYNLDSDKPF